jgi:alcohol dehydrogenase (cytochrome c)
MESSPITYELDGRQYVMTGCGSVLFAWALPKGTQPMPATEQP